MNRRRENIEKELRALRREDLDLQPVMSDLEKRKAFLTRRIKELESQEAQLKAPKDLFITDHAVLRYAQRHYGLDVHAIREEIKKYMAGAGDFGTLKLWGFVIRNNTVVTYTPNIDDYRHNQDRSIPTVTPTSNPSNPKEDDASST